MINFFFFLLKYSWFTLFQVNVVVNFTCQLDWTGDAQVAGKTFFLYVSVRVFPKEMSIWICRLRREDRPHRCSGRHHPIHWGPEEHKKAEEGQIYSLLLPWDISAPGSWTFGLRLGLTPLTPLVLRPLDLEWITSLAFLSLRLTDGRMWEFLPP